MSARESEHADDHKLSAILLTQLKQHLKDPATKRRLLVVGDRLCFRSVGHLRLYYKGSDCARKSAPRTLARHPWRQLSLAIPGSCEVLSESKLRRRLQSPAAISHQFENL